MTQKQTAINVLLPILTGHDIEQLLPFALALADRRGGSVYIADIVEVAANTPLSESVVSAQKRREALDRISRDSPSPLQTGVFVAYSLYEGVCDAVRETQAGLLLVGWDGGSYAAERVFGMPLDQLLSDPPCDLLVIKQQQIVWAPRILLPTNGGPHLSLSFEAASVMAEMAEGTVSVLMARDPEHASYKTPAQIRDLQSHAHVDQLIERIGPALPVILEEARAYDMIVIGATGQRSAPERPVGPLGESLLAEIDRTTIITRRRLAHGEQHAMEQFEAQRDSSARVDKWFAQNTFSSAEFADLDRLVALKYQRDETISLVLPTLNNAATIGPLIDVLKGALLDDVPLLDEIIVIDSNSSDETCTLAAARGIPVYNQQQILSQYGTFAGKGEALWKSLHVATGDIIAWIDTDSMEMHPRLVYGLIGPLLREPRLQFVKGFYRHPLDVEGQTLGANGGRITELVARPLFNLFYPELSGFIQPLSGEYAGRRTTLERLPFFTGYSVESGMLIDLLQAAGLDTMAQVDLEQPMHRAQHHHDLGHMSFTIIQAIMRRLEERQQMRVMDPIHQSLKFINYAEGGGFHLEVQAISDHERPPIQTLPEYVMTRRRMPSNTSSWDHPIR